MAWAENEEGRAHESTPHDSHIVGPSRDLLYIGFSMPLSVNSCSWSRWLWSVFVRATDPSACCLLAGGFVNTQCLVWTPLWCRGLGPWAPLGPVLPWEGRGCVRCLLWLWVYSSRTPCPPPPPQHCKHPSAWRLRSHGRPSFLCWEGGSRWA